MALARAPAALLALAVVGACQRRLPAATPCPAHEAAAWREYRSRHFVLDTDLERGAAAVLIADLERLQALAGAAIPGAATDVPGYVRVVVPARDETYRSIASWVTVGFYTSSALGEPMVVLHPSALRSDPELVAHEVAHHLAWRRFPRQPRWFAEGLAGFVQTVASEAPGGGRAAGLVPREAAGRLRELPAVPAARLLAWRGGAAEGRSAGEYQLWSWVLYHWLRTERRAELADYEARLARADDPARAWRAAFPDLDPGQPGALAALDAALDAHRRRDDLAAEPVSAEAAAAFSEAALPPADVHLLLLDVRRSKGALTSHGRRDRPHGEIARAEVEAALRHDPAHPLARAARARLRGEPEVPALREAVAARGADWRGWLLLADALEPDGDPSEREEAYRRAVSLNPESALAHAGLAWLLASAGRSREALPFAQRAVDLAPASARCLATLAHVAADLGSCEDALALAARAADVLGERGEEDENGRRLRGVEERCGRAPPRGSRDRTRRVRRRPRVSRSVARSGARLPAAAAAGPQPRFAKSCMKSQSASTQVGSTAL